jgi:hypothetical protein
MMITAANGRCWLFPVVNRYMYWCCCHADVACALVLLLQDLYVALPVPEALRSGDNAGSFAFLEKELRFSQM